MRYLAKFGALLLLAMAASGLSLASTTPDLPGVLDAGWVLADLNGDENVDLATARSGRHDASGYAQEVRVSLGAFRQTFFHFQSPGATVELTSRDVDGDDDGDLVVFEPLSTQPIGVWLNDGAGSFHEGRLADFRKLFSEQPGSSWREYFTPLALVAISEERTQLITPRVVLAAPEPVVSGLTRQRVSTRAEAFRLDSRPRGPPRNS